MEPLTARSDQEEQPEHGVFVDPAESRGASYAGALDKVLNDQRPLLVAENTHGLAFSKRSDHALTCRRRVALPLGSGRRFWLRPGAPRFAKPYQCTPETRRSKANLRWSDRQCPSASMAMHSDVRGSMRIVSAYRVVTGARSGDRCPVMGLNRTAPERARRGQMCSHESCILSGQDCGERTYPFRLVVACAPDDGVCARCGGKAARQYREGSAYNMLCAPCHGTGKALSSSDVARELVTTNAGGAEVIEHATRAELNEHGLRAVVERFTR